MENRHYWLCCACVYVVLFLVHSKSLSKKNHNLGAEILSALKWCGKNKSQVCVCDNDESIEFEPILRNVLRCNNTKTQTQIHSTLCR